MYLNLYIYFHRELKSQLKNPSVKRTTRILQNDRSNKDPLLVGILGCGRLGSQIVQCLLTYGKISPANIQISTRRPEILGEFCKFFKLILNISKSNYMFFLWAYTFLLSKIGDIYILCESLCLCTCHVLKMSEDFQTFLKTSIHFKWIFCYDCRSFSATRCWLLLW